MMPYYPTIPERAIPSTKCFWHARYRTTSGRITSSTPVLFISEAKPGVTKFIEPPISWYFALSVAASALNLLDKSAIFGI